MFDKLVLKALRRHLLARADAIHRRAFYDIENLRASQYDAHGKVGFEQWRAIENQKNALDAEAQVKIDKVVGVLVALGDPDDLGVYRD